MDHQNAMPFAIYAELALFLRTSGSTLSMSDAIVRALQQWLKAAQEAESPPTGYQWKCLFLPSGTRLRLRCAEQLFYAEIVHDNLVYRGQIMSPSQMVAAATGAPRNAWRDLWIRRPQDDEWSPASKLRREMQNRINPPEPSPTEAIQLAAKSMSEALQTALMLVDQSRMRAEQQVERRVSKHRRRDDQLADACLED
ncbi:hypothetical protein ACHMW6_22125 [Pseudoduganella sp. UC29_106]|uniref:hypothetical protein n=1 Tax=Pseudoduganella sp. UC29_106 TaxID=3374553 RepID=UPI0037576EAF